MALIVIGEFKFKYYESDFVEALINNGHEVFCFNIWNNGNILSFFLKVEYYFSLIGPATLILYFKKILYLKRLRIKEPLYIIFWRPVLISPFLLSLLRWSLGETYLISYNNDNPFSLAYQKSNKIHLRRLWINFRKSLPLFDISFVYRSSNIKPYMEAGARKVALFPPACPDFLIERFYTQRRDYLYDVVFIGYYESRRLSFINVLLENGVDVKIFGPGWPLHKLSKKYKYGLIKPVYQWDYYETLFKSKLCLCFLSELNEDVFTRRCFEIPACRSVLVCERTKELQDFFKEDYEAIYFEDKEELVEKVKRLLSDSTKIDFISTNAINRSINSGYGLNNQVRLLLNVLFDGKHN